MHHSIQPSSLAGFSLLSTNLVFFFHPFTAGQQALCSPAHGDRREEMAEKSSRHHPTPVLGDGRLQERERELLQGDDDDDDAPALVLQAPAAHFLATFQKLSPSGMAPISGATPLLKG